ncbi:MAG: hypothetical protein RBS23_06820 [Mariniphaga sp.]|jgi:tetratricopeptide (TPR) repeat protein|nr:hypothetical protein [Mariniphaga sp.]MDY0143901.1 hypothetical protein [Bacteroidales bacterium]
MKNPILTVLFLHLVLISCFSQESRQYANKADSSYYRKNYSLAIEYYKKAFSYNTANNAWYENYSYSDKLAKLASCYAHLSIKDSALFYMNKAVDQGFILHSAFVSLGEYGELINDPEWIRISKKQDSLFCTRHKNIDLAIAMEVREMFKKDQYIRGYSIQAIKLKKNKHIIDSIDYVAQIIDSINVKKLIRIMDEVGYPGTNIVSGECRDDAFFIIQHASLEIQKKYLPDIIDAVENNQVSGITVAFLIDRILISDGKKQLYGTQYFLKDDGIQELAPVEDPVNLEKRRKEIGLTSEMF